MYLMLCDVLVYLLCLCLDFVLGDRNGILVLFWISVGVVDVVIVEGFWLWCNLFFVGVYIIVVYGKLCSNVYVVQFEMDRLFYMDECWIELCVDFDVFVECFIGIVVCLVCLCFDVCDLVIVVE